MRRIVSILCAVCMLVACAPAVTPAPGNFISATKTQAAFQKTQTFLCCTAVPKLSPTAVSDIATPPAPTVTPSQRPLTLGPDVTHYRGNSQRTGAYDFPAIRTLPALIWQKRFGSNTLLSAPIVAEDMLYVGVQRGGQLYALNPDTGDELWSVPTGEMPSHVAVAGDLVVVNDMRGRTLGIHRQRGTQLWSFATSGSPWGAPLILDEAVYIVSERGAYALEARTGQIIWQKNTGSHRGFVGSPAFAEGRLYFGVGPAFYALDALTGEEQWKVQRETWFYGTAVANGLIYVGNDDGYLYALDQSTGEEIWKSNVAGMGWSAPAIANDVVFVGNIDQHIYALDAHSGAELWKTEVEDWASADPVVSDGVVYVGNGNHEMREGQRHLYALDAQTGAELWKFLADARLLMAPALSTDKIYIVTTLGTLYALEAKPATSTVTAIHHGEGGRAGDAHVGPHSSVPGV